MPKHIQHWGVRGMHWGVRRARGPSSDDHNSASTLRKKHVSEMSNDDLKKLTARMQLERSYKDLKKDRVSSGQKIVAGILLASATTVATAYATKALRSGVDLAIKTMLSGRV